MDRKDILNYVNIEIHKTDITIAGKICFMCGRVFKKEELHNLTRHHAIPKKFSPKFDIFIPLCKKCHHTFNVEAFEDDEEEKKDEKEKEE